MDEVFGSDTSGLSLRSWRIIVSPRDSELLNLSSHLGLGSHRKAAPGAPLSNGGRNGRYTRRSVECICSHSGGRSPTRCGLHYQYLEKITCSPPGGLEEIHIYELSKGRYVEIEEDELQAIEIESVRRQSIWERRRRDLVEDAAHLTADFKRRFFGVASGDFGLCLV